jgi:signal transduction histidine kinase
MWIVAPMRSVLSVVAQRLHDDGTSRVGRTRTPHDGLAEGTEGLDWMSTRKTTRRPGPYRHDTFLPRLHTDDEPTSQTETNHVELESTTGGPRGAMLTVVVGKEVGRIFGFPAEVNWLGRDASCQVHLNERGISRRHASVVRIDDRLVLRDNHAKNGTFINGQRIVEQELWPGDEIQLGTELSLLYTSANNRSERIAQQRVARERVIRERMYLERIESMANLVARLAHVINTPLGVANTANGMLMALAKDIEAENQSPHMIELVNDLKSAASLMSKNLERASRLVSNFRQLSTRHLADEYVRCDLAAVVRECAETMQHSASRAEGGSRSLEIRIKREEGPFPWGGFPGHLAHVLENLAGNTLLHGYPPDAPAVIEIRMKIVSDRYVLEFEDFGRGVPADILPRIFEPFVSSARAEGGTGLGLAIAHNIVSNLLHGHIVCTSKPGVGTKFVLELPQRVPEPRPTSLLPPSLG